jgi:hypothetical protein
MNLLYRGRYRKRFHCVENCLGQSDVVELCFGDIYLARFCKKNKLKWTGYDINPDFVKHARRREYNAICADISKLEQFEPAGNCVMMGSFYHFFDNFEEILAKMLTCADRIIISEPVKNISAGKGVVGKIAQSSSDVGEGREAFRFNEKTLTGTLDLYKEKLSFNYSIEKCFKKDMIIIIEK